MGKPKSIHGVETGHLKQVGKFTVELSGGKWGQNSKHGAPAFVQNKNNPKVWFSDKSIKIGKKSHSRFVQKGEKLYPL